MLDDGTLAELRVSRVGHTKDPGRGREALLALAAADVPLVPKPLGGGTTAGAAWATESVLTGEHVHALTPDLLGQVTRFLAALPAGLPDRRAVDDQLVEVAGVFPEHAPALAHVAAAVARWGEAVPPVLIHGDMWLNNVFITDDRLSGVFDWDTWHPAGLPGTDVLNLLAANVRTQQGRDIGPLFVDDYWRSPEVRDALRAYFDARGMPFPDAAGLAAIAVGWWASRMAGSLHRARRDVDDPAWTRANIVDVLAKIEQLERELG
jgi:Ser/Thr protein kinase RdoA (MazF antagonist)